MIDVVDFFPAVPAPASVLRGGKVVMGLDNDRDASMLASSKTIFAGFPPKHWVRSSPITRIPYFYWPLN
jgi:hypothetical protein